ncbi:MAG: FHA domain-containing protein [Streptosporangiales bacterium]|nr:FHA domain-containing protein [Streptosporangiales bacterium]
MATVYCTQCGHANPQESRFCANCGTALTHAGDPVGEPGATTSTLTWRVADLGEGEDEAPTEDVATVEALRPGTAMLVVRRGPNAGSRFLLDRDVTTVGRHAESDIFLDDITVSRRHAEFRRTGTDFSVADVGSLNGTYVNKDRIDTASLTGGDEVMIGKFRMVFFEAPEVGQE